jgi:hypothetical protein
MKENLELRMYGLTPYNISPIQQGIQFGHAVVEYGQNFKNDKTYNDWADNHKTFIILNGGTTNTRFSIEDSLPLGTLNNHLLTLKENDIDLAYFQEPDLGDQLTAIVFIVDERVFNRKKYPDFSDWLFDNYEDYINVSGFSGIDKNKVSYEIINSNSEIDRKIYQKWLKIVGGQKNAFLREFLKNFRLA